MERPQISKVSPVQVEQTVEEAFMAIIRSQFEQVLAWEPLALEGSDSEGVHQMRVAYRRMRSALTTFRRAIPREVSRQIGSEMRWAASSLGPAREVDVFLEEGLPQLHGHLNMAEGEQHLTAQSQRFRQQSYQQVQAVLESERYRQFKRHLDVWLKERGWRVEIQEASKLERLDGPIAKFASKVLEKQMARVMSDGEEISRLSAEELHQLRIDCKKLRYATDFFRELYPAKRVDAFIGELKQVQDLLGIMNDGAVMPALLDEILQGVEDAPARSYADAILGWRAYALETQRGQLPERWGHFMAAPLPWAEPRKRKGQRG
ncbi:CHAD domain containing protein [Magnetococcus marinus MC-1]|uniref:CHAD domain containing protein n=1 Tax=Magnetococcus marinus (strain ATCC BAA-1437 / JCM 17883 / MC-1) TaxID=156889 RepID=A0L502_MAGMM|nr:CHAD domain-containing protein [Magnetococcus marinus]ABK43045.1 CHAD domain containing protein [Magnetococcus marinus MC-1]